MTALVLRIKFPPTYPLIYKTLRIDSNLTVIEAIKFIGETLNVACGGNIGLYLPDEKRWLDDNAPLSTYDNLQEEEYIEYRDRDQPTDDKRAGMESRGCCVIA
mmetsp:Transcript_20921/g.35619  ORF Transcript_20921/g.35619 Transcript_20921/m.35619 type:complete len:103 (-) Transcript_20921:117-425(-)